MTRPTHCGMCGVRLHPAERRGCDRCAGLVRNLRAADNARREERGLDDPTDYEGAILAEAEARYPSA